MQPQASEFRSVTVDKAWLLCFYLQNQLPVHFQ